MEVKIGEVFNHPKFGKITAKEQNGCSGCLFKDSQREECFKSQGKCSDSQRDDHKSVIFVKAPKVEKSNSERPLGSIFKDREFGDLIVCEYTECEDCVFVNRNPCGTEDENEGHCNDLRSDNTSVMFKKYTPPSSILERGVKVHKDLEQIISTGNILASNDNSFHWCEPVPVKPANWDRVSDNIVVERETGIRWIHDASLLETDPRTILLSE